MTWRENLRRVVQFDGRRLIGASFRGVPFFVEAADRTGGRRTVTHEFPLRDNPYIEDLGRKARVFTVEGYLIGDDYLVHRDALIEALEEVSGPGELIHPYHGVRRAVCSLLTVREAISSGGMARVSIEFIEAPAQALAATGSIDLAERVSVSASAALVATQAEFADQYDAAGLPSFALESAAAALSALATDLGVALAPVVEDTQELARLDVAIQSLVSEASSLVREPGEVLGAFMDVLLDLSETALASPAEVMRAIVVAYSADIGPRAPYTTATRQRERDNQDALAAGLRRLLAIEAARLASLAEYETGEEATSARDDVIELLEEQAETAGDVAYPALLQLRADLARAVPGDAALARLVTVERRVSVPALLLSYQIHGSVDQEPGIVARNRIRHPGFVSGSLQVLIDE